MSLVDFATDENKKKTLGTGPATSTNSLLQFANKGGPTLGATSTAAKTLLGSDAAMAPRNVDDARKLQEENPTLWGRISKNLMKPVGLVATLSEETGRVTGDLIAGDTQSAKRDLLATPGKLGGIITGTRSRSFSDIWRENGAELGIDPRVSFTVGLITDLAADPLNFIGGGLTKAGKLADKATALQKANQSIKGSSKLGKQIAALGLHADDLVLAPTKAEQVARGQRALLTLFANTRWEKTIAGGAPVYAVTGNIAKGVASTKLAQIVGKVFSTKTSNEAFNTVKRHFDNLLEYRKGQVMDEALDIQTSIGKLSQSHAEDVLEVIETGKKSGIAAIDDIAMRLKDNFKNIKDKEEGLGLLKTDIQEYFPHIKVTGAAGKKTTWQKFKSLFTEGTGASKADTSSISSAKASGQSFDEWVKGQTEPPKIQTDTVNGNNIVTLYHGTSKSNAERIRKDGVIRLGGEDSDIPNKVFLTSHPDRAKEFGSELIEVKLRYGDKNLTDIDGTDLVYSKDIKLPPTHSQLKAEWDKAPKSKVGVLPSKADDIVSPFADSKKFSSKLGAAKERKILRFVSEAGTETGVGTAKTLGLKKLKTESAVARLESSAKSTIARLQEVQSRLIKKDVAKGTADMRATINMLKKHVSKLDTLSDVKNLDPEDVAAFESVVKGAVNAEKEKLALRIKDLEEAVLTSQGTEFLKGPIMDKLTKEQRVVALQKEITKTVNELNQQVGRYSFFDYIDKSGKLHKSIKGSETFSGFGQATVKEINEAFGTQFFESRPAIAFAQRALASTKAVTSKELYDSVRQFGVDAADEAAEFAHFVPSKIKELEGLKFAPEIVRSLEAYQAKIKPEELNVALRTFDQVQNWWKAQALVAPSYHVRNIVGNMWNNFLAGITDPRVYFEAGQVQYGKPVQFVDDVGRQWDNATLMKAAKESGVINEGWYAKDIETAIGSELAGNSWNPLKQNFGLFRANRAVGSTFENNARIAHFIQRLKEGSTIDDAALSVKKFLFDYGDLTAIEKNLFKRVSPFYTWCFSDDTEVLTSRGWQTRSTIKVGEPIPTINQKTEQIEIQKVKELGVFNWDGDLVRIKNRNFDLLMTQDHRCVYHTRSGSRKGAWSYLGWRVKEASQITPMRDWLPIASRGWNGVKTPEFSDDFIELLGWVISEGSYYKNYINITQSPSPKKYLNDIKKLLTRLDIDFRTSPKAEGDCINLRFSGEILKKIVELLPEKELTFDLLFRLSRTQLDILYITLIKGDGHFDRNGGETFYQINKKTTDAFQALTTLIGRASRNRIRPISSFKGNHFGSKPVNTVRVKNNRYVTYFKKLNEHYTGKVWCPATDNGIIFVRRNGIVMITGQTRKNIPLQLENLFTQPGKFATIPKTAEAIESTVPQPNEKFLGDYIKDNVGIRVGEDSEGNTMYFLLGNWLPAAQAIDFLSQPIENFVMSISPFLKTPVELWANQSTFFEDTFGQPSKIERYSEENQSWLGFTMRKKTAYVLKNIRILNELDKLNPGSIFGDKDTPSLANRIAPEMGFRAPFGIGNVTTSERRGGRFTPEGTSADRILQSMFGKTTIYNPNYAKRFYLWDTQTKVEELTRAIKDAQRDGQTEYAKRLRQELQGIKKERSK